MLPPVRVAVFLLLACALLCWAPTIVKGKKKGAKKEETFLQELRNKLINYIASKKKYDSNGWVDLSLVQRQGFQPIDLRIEDNKVVCNSNNQIMEVTVVNQKLLKHAEDASYHELTLRSKNIPPDDKLLSVIPLMKMKTKKQPGAGMAPSKRSGFITLDALPPNFKGYIVCTKKDTSALLVPKTLNPVQFVSGPWKVRVSIDFYKCPLSNFGRIFQVTIIDKVNVLLNNEKSFIWPIPLTSFFEVYDFHLAVRECKKGNFCELERTANGGGNNGSLIFNCPGWGKSHTLTLANALFLSAYLGMSVAHGLVYTSSSMHKSTDEYLTNTHNRVSMSTPRLHKRIIRSYESSEKEEEERKSELKQLNLITNLLFLGGAGIAHAAYGVKTLVDIVKNLNSINEEFENAVSFYPWELRYPQSYLASQGSNIPKVELAKEPITSVKKAEPNSGQAASSGQAETTYEMDASQIAHTGNKQGTEAGCQQKPNEQAPLTQAHNNTGENESPGKESKPYPNVNEPNVVKIFEQNIMGN
ncbi:hypothetical protein AK88_02315 [Plasmodium fragile]|uniref:Uncharacterized protein n=1 Tax=Plasmodium fragile TaxID=5857 RepID=A0A0D9QLT6_PLAFR|nr:uncharacterized protein AK88_02315 [Plasmodium fragile]KJP88040.1 hypothetical protein AK88_02315 [Plasmodium fragile]